MWDGGRDKTDITPVLLCSPLSLILANSITIHVTVQAKILQFSLIYHSPSPLSTSSHQQIRAESTCMAFSESNYFLHLCHQKYCPSHRNLSPKMLEEPLNFLLVFLKFVLQ